MLKKVEKETNISSCVTIESSRSTCAAASVDVKYTKEETTVGTWLRSTAGDPTGRNLGWTTDQWATQEGKKEDQLNWEESSLIKFSHFLGFSTEGLEKDILNFLGKIRKRREKIVDKGLLETSRFERELKRLECSVNMKGMLGRKALNRAEGSKVQLSNECGEESRAGRFLDWKALNAMGTVGGVLICWDKRSLELLGVEEGQFSISCRFRNVGDGAIWVFTGVYGPCSRKDRECLWEEFGAIRGLWRIHAMRRFAQVIDELGLVDIPLQGGSFTWSGGLNNQSWARLDRFLVSPNWIDQYSRATQRRLPRPTSDHFPILLEGGGLRRGPYPFKFENMWLKAEGFKELIEGWVEKNKAEALQQVERCDIVEEGRHLTEEELGHKNTAKENYSKWVSMEEVHWRQLSRELWLREGDRNTGFFHRMANAHRRANNLVKIKINEVRFAEDQEVRDGIVNAYQQLLSESSDWKADIGGLVLTQISLSEAEALECPFSEAEIYAALMGMNGDKAPGPDGFTVAFWQSCWEIVKEDVLDMFKEFYDHNSFIKSLNHTFLVLIPKKGGAEDLGDYRPISLLGGLYKLLAKVLANRLKKIIDKVISSDQNAFIKGRQILDGSLIANEGYAKDGIWIKMDRMDAELYFYCQIFNTGEWGSSWGFINGCRIWKGRGQAVNITHLLFADDTIVFCEAKKESLLYLSWILLWFEAASGLKINLEKSMVIPVGEVEGVLDMAAEIGCKVGQLPTVYLGLPLGAPNRASYVWDGVEEKMRRKLALWKRQFLSKGGRTTLIKSTLASIPLDNGGNKAHLIKWEVVSTDKKKGGLGLRKLVWLNKALLGKWVWRFARAKEELWKKVLEAKYGQEEFGWRTRKANGVFGVGVWKEILKESTWCWETWCSRWEKATKNVTVEDYWDQNLSQGGWSLRLLRDFNDWELGGGADGLFKFKEAYKVLSNADEVDFPHSNVWVDKVPTKIAFFAWEATWGRLASHKYATVANLWGRQGDGGGCWEVHFRRFFQDWELKELGTAKPKNLPRARVFKPKFEGSLYPFIDRVVSVVFGVG
ncbi:Transposon TX1 uncharacterized 149 kDa protein [Vitis vinifera]|uniref:Transposon TX1 uncharacterized 149 kDa protein n=1 Tax=Vitis vinifera TaxID=29760 RepID=A0A438IYU3_VITVI|nr:Transposon TX1 uncharacterized 149 kDa protein [Vitis vinifera]